LRLRMTFSCSFGFRERIGRKKNARTLVLERLEDRLTPSVPSLGGARPTFIASPFVPPSSPQGGQGSFGGYFAPSDIQTAYGISQLLANGKNGAGMTIALIDAFDTPSLVSSTSPSFSTSDLHKFDVQFGLPDPPSFRKVGGSGRPNWTSNLCRSLVLKLGDVLLTRLGVSKASMRAMVIPAPFLPLARSWLIP